LEVKKEGKKMEQISDLKNTQLSVLAIAAQASGLNVEVKVDGNTESVTIRRNEKQTAGDDLLSVIHYADSLRLWAWKNEYTNRWNTQAIRYDFDGREVIPLKNAKNVIELYSLFLEKAAA
jgi:hypothetical protein